MVKVFKLDKHDCSVWIGHTEAIQDRHYLKVINEDYKAALQQWSESSVDGLEYTSLFFSLVYESLEKNLPELAPAAFNHAQQITRKAMQGMFANTTPNTPIRQYATHLMQSLMTSCSLFWRLPALKNLLRTLSFCRVYSISCSPVKKPPVS